MNNINYKMVHCYTVPQVAILLKVKKTYVYDLINSNQLPAIRLSERRYRISEQALMEFLKGKSEWMENTDNVIHAPVRG
ncbi:DNA-binding protein, excisionase family [Desulfitobacterium dichloroeliminans LMG P-21439]|uniref:DNA-binding protein, excisionase family n=1 Tax=Desulfitobacterium dichloroeliminans (strain LMG P-21439 / DCA1) TaxID=871963 RepID=L0F3E0_DESDL|nr:helix-turn-helix domain-containing protein [Desulfitobacterium dichloroeliminans]AGA67692.1 DNA-binding protein, excisionase family [Desulfitobacterium dichloroeliminans LMG P-21439]